MYRIILAEDENIIRNAIAKNTDWNAHGFTLAGACENGGEVLKLMDNDPADVIITDIDMPVMDGLALSVEIFNRWPDTKVIILSAYNDINYVKTAGGCNIHSYIFKPVTPRQINALLGNLRAELGANLSKRKSCFNGIESQVRVEETTAKKLVVLGRLRRNIMQETKLLNLTKAELALNMYIDKAQELVTPEQATALIQNLFVLLMEYAAEQGFEIDYDLHRITLRSDINSMRECLRVYITELIGTGIVFSNSSNRYGAVAVEYIKDNYSNPNLSISDMSTHLLLSSSYFSSIFKSYTGTTFTEFLTLTRVNKAKELLLTTDKKNYEIAAMVGYDDPGYFRLIFKKLTGLSPSQFRKESGRD